MTGALCLHEARRGMPVLLLGSAKRPLCRQIEAAAPAACRVMAGGDFADGRWR